MRQSLFILMIFLISAFMFFGCNMKNPLTYSMKKEHAPIIPEQADPITDIDGNTYQTAKIGNQIWMAENLIVTHYRNGDAIPNVTSKTEWKNLLIGALCNCDNDEIHVATYGRLYNWYAVNDSRNVAPEGWHVPSDEEWKELEMYLGMSQSETDTAGWRGTNEGGKLKEKGRNHWRNPNTGSTNESGFSALPGGYRDADGSFGNLFGYNFSYTGFLACFWTSTECNSDQAWYRALSNDHSGISRSRSRKKYGYSIRCVRD